jgi:hypothetical protein
MGILNTHLAHRVPVDAALGLASVRLACLCRAWSTLDDLLLWFRPATESGAEAWPIPVQAEVMSVRFSRAIVKDDMEELRALRTEMPSEVR